MERQMSLSSLASYIPCRFLLRCSRLKFTLSLTFFIVATLAIFSYTGQHRYDYQQEKSLVFQEFVESSASKEKDNDTMKTHGDTVMMAPAALDPVVTKRWCSSSESPTNIVFIKVHKSGSSTVSNLLARYALNHDLNIALPEQKPVGDVFHCFGPFREYRVVPLAKGQPYHMLFNHMIYNRTALNNVMPKNAFYVAIMREPVKRFLSGIYYFGKLRPPARNNTDNHAFKLFISDSNRPKLEKNFRIYNSVAWNTGLPLEEHKKADSVEKHLQRLDQELDLMMVMEHFLESLVLFKRLACLSLRDIVFMKINARRTYNMHNITPQDLDLLKSWQMADHMAYEHFYAKFWNLVRQEGDSFPIEVDYFRKVTERVTSYCSGNSAKWDVLVIRKSQWNEEFSLNQTDCQLMKSDERELQKLLLNRAKDRRDRAGYRETRNPIPKWNSDC